MHPVNYFAYLDAGTGSLIVQSVVGIIAGIAVFARKFLLAIPHKIKGMFQHDKNSTDTVANNKSDK